MTDKEKAICKQYSKRDKNGKVHCVDCPLVIDKTACVCKKVLEDSQKLIRQNRNFDEYKI